MTEQVDQLPPVKFVRLKTGEDLISYCVPHVGHLQLIHPVRVYYYIDEDTGKMAITMAEWVTASIIKVPIFELQIGDVLLLKETSDSMETAYAKIVAHYREKGEASTQRINLVDESGEVVETNQADAPSEDQPGEYINLAGATESEMKEFMSSNVADPVRKILH